MYNIKVQHHAPTNSPVGIAQNKLTNHELVSIHINIKILDNSGSTQRYVREMLREIYGKDTRCN